MILFFGTRPGKSENVRLVGVYCPHCDQLGTLAVRSYTNYFHLFWIKIFKISSNKIAECTHCKRIYDQGEFTEAMLQMETLGQALDPI